MVAPMSEEDASGRCKADEHFDGRPDEAPGPYLMVYRPEVAVYHRAEVQSDQHCSGRSEAEPRPSPRSMPPLFKQARRSPRRPGLSRK